MRLHSFLAFCLLFTLTAPLAAQRGTLSPSAQAFAQQAQALREIQYNLQTLASRFDAAEQQQSALSARLAALERGAGTVTKDDLAALRSDLNVVKSAQERMRGEIVEDLSTRISDISTRESRAREAAERKNRDAPKSGYSHIVEAGQTLSAIAQAYKVSVQAIMRANKISDPTKIQVGQKLFIPDP